MTDIVDRNASRRLVIPPLGRLYAALGDTAETVLRVVAGLALVTHGWSKIANPFGAAGMVESLGFYPGAFWSLMLALTEFFGGMLIAIGLLTRPASFAAMFVLLVTVWFHWVLQSQGFFHWIVRSEGYSGAEKSILWAAIFFFFAIRGANRHSVDAKLGKEF